LLYLNPNDETREDRKMAATTNQTQIGRIANELNKTTDGVRYAQNSLLNELPGAVFAVITLAYVVSSLVHLI
jgi:hypothetical protein